ncbi:MAG: glycosyltransferase family 4 protein [Clostridiales bacterium]|nr:glycosyltransferase family 4 protein [Clostridiales bacterium]MDR3239334.1 glycosyltransferase family 4 protein [Clostridiales bacterium]
MKKVVHVITDTNIGGAGMLLLNFLRRANHSAFEYIVLTPERSALTPRIEALGVQVLETPGIGERSLSLSSIGRFRRVFRSLRPDIVHTHAALSARAAARLCGKCQIVHTRHCAFDLPARQKKFPLRQIMGSVNNVLSDHIIAISPAAEENLVDTGVNPEKISVLFNGVEQSPFLEDQAKKEIRRQYGVGDNEFVCAIIARLEEYKGQRVVLEAAGLLREYPIRFLIAGEGTDEAYLKNRAEELRLNSIVFTGFVNDIYKIENIMDLQINASFGSETSSLSLLEGMSLGAAAVASDFGGNPYLILHGENGLIFEKKNARALADAVLSLYIDQAALHSMGEQASQIYQRRFTASIMAKSTEAVYERLLKSSKIKSS